MRASEEIRRLRREILRLRQFHATGQHADRSPWDWYGATCPCGLPPGDCLTHARARPNQRPPQGDWRTWTMLMGRGSGKTRSAAEWIIDRVERRQARFIALVGATAADTRDTMITGESGILTISPPWNRPKYEPSKRRLTWANGAVATTFSADAPERLRGPSVDTAWCDELASWDRGTAWDNLKLGLRLGKPAVVVTTTPRPTATLKSILAAESTAITKGSTYENRAHLAPEFLEEIMARYEGTRLGRQEIHAEVLEFLEGAVYESFDPSRHVSEAAEYDPALPVIIAVDCGVSRHTAAVFLQSLELGGHRHRVTCFADYYCEGAMSEENARAILDYSASVCGTRMDKVVLDPAASARTGTGPAAFNEYRRIFGERLTSYWPQHRVSDGIELIEILLGAPGREPELLIHPRCKHLIAGFQGYERASSKGVYLDYFKDPQHPHEDLMDALRGGIRQMFPSGRKIKLKFPTRRASDFF